MKSSCSARGPSACQPKPATNHSPLPLCNPSSPLFMFLIQLNVHKAVSLYCTWFHSLPFFFFFFTTLIRRRDTWHSLLWFIWMTQSIYIWNKWVSDQLDPEDEDASAARECASRILNVGWVNSHSYVYLDVIWFEKWYIYKGTYP